jgi:hypothetical protein
VFVDSIQPLSLEPPDYREANLQGDNGSIGPLESVTLAPHLVEVRLPDVREKPAAIGIGDMRTA